MALQLVRFFKLRSLSFNWQDFGVEMAILSLAVFIGLWLWRWQFYFTPMVEQLRSVAPVSKRRLWRLLAWSLTASFAAKHKLKHLNSPVFSLVFLVMWACLYLFAGFTSTSLFIKGMLAGFSFGLASSFLDKFKNHNSLSGFYLFLNMDYPAKTSRAIILAWIAFILILTLLTI